MARDTKKKDKKKKTGTVAQIRQIFAFTYNDDKALPWYLAAAFLLPVLVALVGCLIFKVGWLSWTLTMLLGVMLGVLLATITLTRRSDRVGYRQMDGRPGAAGAILANISKAGFSFSQDPIWIDPKTKDAIWRGCGRTGVYLVGEGDYGRVMRAMGREEDKVKRITQGSAIPIYKVSVGHGDKQVPLEKLQKAILRKKAKLTAEELNQLKARLNTLQLRQSSLNMPKGMDPTKVHVSRRALRGK
ncbi:hypothetical protein BACT_0938 [Bifidobacterium actinocoloniiforme DSM 22766]|uniref:Integral membrane protein n=1 Tax=Bifidobacterium actinocoloniiforme DSM 22766 TaxID=1437605 RepID=A0A086Z136_9BIFI|nr:DUF4191 domain-containing protein [Bifidobacterium actinocoloniiforme]AKV55410.1 membrane protein [Bifidobacterium actinocoloniiforme DSM 22766]KFI40236.1 hypothetical protein BACT_0938 [Bifidobacterium actinocoloniiforme DSM 22766]